MHSACTASGILANLPRCSSGQSSPPHLDSAPSTPACRSILVVWAVVFLAFARNATQTSRPKGLSEMLGVLAHEPLAWLLAAFYFLTFGGFVAFSIYLPTLLRDQFDLKPADAGFRAAGFVVLATLCRPLGGWLSDRIGGSRVLSWILPAIAAFGLLLGVWSMIPFTVGALGDFAIGVFPKAEEILVCSLRLCYICSLRIGASAFQMGEHVERAEGVPRFFKNYTSIINHFIG